MTDPVAETALEQLTYRPETAPAAELSARAGECPWCDCGFWAEPHPCGRAVARTVDVAEATVALARGDGVMSPSSPP